eukprot:1053750-Pleurochrysis_carterae.AAC.4
MRSARRRARDRTKAPSGVGGGRARVFAQSGEWRSRRLQPFALSLGLVRSPFLARQHLLRRVKRQLALRGEHAAGVERRACSW